MKKLLFLLAVLLLPVFSFGQAQTKIIKIGYIDIQKVLKSYNEGKKVVDYLKTLKDSYEKKKNDMEAEIRKLEKELETKSKELSENQVRDYLTQIESGRQELEIFVKNANNDIDKKEKEMLKPVYEKILTTIREEAPKLGFNFIIDSRYVLVADPELDITELILKVIQTK